MKGGGRNGRDKDDEKDQGFVFRIKSGLHPLRSPFFFPFVQTLARQKITSELMRLKEFEKDVERKFLVKI